jgi:flagellar hook assembly protein FlgD
MPTALLSNFPNPFNPETTIHFSVGSTSASPVNIIIYDIRGRQIRTLIDGIYSKGEHFAVWNGKDDNGQNVSSGIYLYKMQTGDFVQTKRMVIIK